MSKKHMTKQSDTLPRLTVHDLRRVIADVEKTGGVPDGYSIDLARPDDLDGLLDLAAACFDYDVPDRQEILYFLTRAHCAFFVFRRDKDNALAGYILLEANRRTRSLYGNTTCVHPDCQGLGLGRISYYLKQRLLALSPYKAINAHVAVDNKKTIHLLEKYGFRINSRIEAYYDDGRDAFKMRMTEN